MVSGSASTTNACPAALAARTARRSAGRSSGARAASGPTVSVTQLGHILPGCSGAHLKPGSQFGEHLEDQDVKPQCVRGQNRTFGHKVTVDRLNPARCGGSKASDMQCQFPH